jgi:hypothetical protein
MDYWAKFSDIVGVSLSVHQMELLGDMGQIEGCIALFGDSANLDVR